MTCLDEGSHCPAIRLGVPEQCRLGGAPWPFWAPDSFAKRPVVVTSGDVRLRLEHPLLGAMSHSGHGRDAQENGRPMWRFLGNSLRADSI